MRRNLEQTVLVSAHSTHEANYGILAYLGGTYKRVLRIMYDCLNEYVFFFFVVLYRRCFDEKRVVEFKFKADRRIYIGFEAYSDFSVFIFS